MSSPALWFHDNKIGVFPLVKGTKEPARACKWKEFECSRSTVETFDTHYGVRTGRGIAVLDTDSEASESFISSEIAAGHIPATPFTVKTYRGLHRYFKLALPTTKFLHRLGMAIELRNENQYVVGPNSVHPSGVIYTAADWSWSLDDVPFFPRDYTYDDGSCGLRSSQRAAGEHYAFPEAGVAVGERRAEMFKLIRSLKGLGNSKDAVWWCIQLTNENFCHPPLPLAELRGWFGRAYDQADRPMETTHPGCPCDPFAGDEL